MYGKGANGISGGNTYTTGKKGHRLGMGFVNLSAYSLSGLVQYSAALQIWSRGYWLNGWMNFCMYKYSGPTLNLLE